MTENTVMRHYVSPKTIEHRCDLPKGTGERRTWECPVCRMRWSLGAYGGGSGDGRGRDCKIVAYAVVREDGSTETFHIDHPSVITEDGVRVYEGARVFDYYDGHWGEILKIHDDGWFDHERNDGTISHLDGQRVALVVPDSNPFYDKWLEGK